MDKRIPDSVLPYKQEVEKLAGKEIFISDYKEDTAYFDGNQTIFADLDLPSHELEEKLFHELTHALFRYSGYPSTILKQAVSNEESKCITKILSLPEELIVDKYLASRSFPFEDNYYDDVYYAVINSIDGPSATSLLTTIIHHLRYIRLILDKKHIGGNVTLLKENYIRANGIKNWNFISKIAEGLKSIMALNISDQEKLHRMFTLMLNEYKLSDKIEVK